MPRGLLEVDGSIDLAQFWPKGKSDADTTQVQVTVAPESIRFRSDPGGPFRPSRVLEDASVTGAKGKTKVLKNGKFTVRLQGIDAPELHYQPTAEVKKADRTPDQDRLFRQWNPSYRQPMAETATIALTQFLENCGGPQVPCKVRTAVDAPNDVFDVYGRLVGNIFVQTATGEQDVNLWLAENGWVMPAFYTSMSAEEIEALTQAAAQAYYGGLGIWPLYSSGASVGDFDPSWVFRSPGVAPDPHADRGPVVTPKLFRRLVNFAANKKSGMVKGRFVAWLASKRPADAVHLTADFLEQGAEAAPLRHLDEFITAGEFTVWPEEIVFREQPTRLVNAQGVRIERF